MDKDTNKNLKDSRSDTSLVFKDTSIAIPYSKTNKLINALYIVTDIMDAEEPIRKKLRTLGLEIISDTISLTRFNLVRRIQAILSLLDIAFTMNMISEMNKNILAGEFIQLKNSLAVRQDNPTWLEEFLRENKEVEKDFPHSHNSIGHKGQESRTRIGVQKGSTLMKALSDKIGSEARSNMLGLASRTDDFDLLKKERRFDIINIIKAFNGSATITDIRTKAQGSIISCSEKTLQRELMSMIKDGVLNKIGEKRWTQYRLLAS